LKLEMKSLDQPHAEERSLQQAQPMRTCLRGERVSKHVAAPSFATRTFGALLRMRTVLAFVLGLLAVGLTIPVHAQSLDLSGKTVTLAIATPSGGGYDLYGRMVARHIGRYLPGNPTVVPQNMPGAGSLIAANWLANVAPKDGTAIAIIPSATLFENLLGNTQARFDARALRWLVSLNDYTAVAMAWHDTPFMTADDLLSKEFLVGSNAPASDTTVWPLLLNALIGTKTKLVRGYPGTAGISLAMERGEVQGMIGDDWASIKANKASWLSEKKVRILMQMTADRHADLADVPLASEFAKDEDNRQVLALFVARQKYGRPFLAPPGTPDAVADVYREAFAKLVTDGEFLRDAQQAQLIIKAAPGAEVTALVQSLHTLPREVIEKASALIRRITQ
jgi:tripartite-type tricarboxylate transporter receptor subunit TctC